MFDCRKYHWYPATFVPEIPYSLIEVLSRPGQVVLDPFAGIGTTILQGLILGRRPFGIERCRVAVEYVRALWSLLDRGTDLEGVRASLARLQKRCDFRRDYGEELLAVDPEYGGLLRPWFNAETFRQIAFLVLEERREDQVAVRAGVRIALSATLKATTAQDKGWGCIADNVLPKDTQCDKIRDALGRFQRNWRLLLDGIKAARARMSKDALNFVTEADVGSHVIHGDARKDRAVAEPTVDLVVTSPPYPNMTDYATSQRLSYYLLGSRPDDDFRTEVGARRRRTRRDALDAYRFDMDQAFRLVVEQMRDGGHACLVMPTFAVDKDNNRRRRHVVDECLTTLVQHGLTQIHRLERVLPARRRHHNQRWTSLERETIYVYQKI